MVDIEKIFKLATTAIPVIGAAVAGCISASTKKNCEETPNTINADKVGFKNPKDFTVNVYIDNGYKNPIVYEEDANQIKIY